MIQCKECLEHKDESCFVYLKKFGKYRKICRECHTKKNNTSLAKTLGIELHDKIRAKQRLHLNAIRHKAKTRGIDFDLTAEDIKIPELCPILEKPMYQLWGYEGDKSTGYTSDGLLIASVDRLDNSKGYTKDNILVCSLNANRFKSNMSTEDLVNFCQNYLKYARV
jgi:hypothetical protein